MEGRTREQYRNDGFTILSNFFTEEELLDWEETVAMFYAFQGLKVPEIREELTKGNSPLSYRSVQDLDALLYLFEQRDRKTGYHACLLSVDSLAGKKLLVNERLISVASLILECPKELMILSNNSPSIFYNLPSRIGSGKRMLYHWHTEFSYYPKRRNFFTAWIPIFRDKTLNNGTMHVARGSHKKRHEFAEYKGFDDDTLESGDAYRQLETPEYELTEFDKVPIIAARGDLVLMDGNTVHKSSLNEEDTPSYVTVIRYYDYSRDLTLSSELGAGQFGGTPYARPGLLNVEYQ